MGLLESNQIAYLVQITLAYVTSFVKFRQAHFVRTRVFIAFNNIHTFKALYELPDGWAEDCFALTTISLSSDDFCPLYPLPATYFDMLSDVFNRFVPLKFV